MNKVLKFGYMSGIDRLRPDVSEVQRGLGIGQAHQHVQLHHGGVLGRLEVQIRSGRISRDYRRDYKYIRSTSTRWMKYKKGFKPR